MSASASIIPVTHATGAFPAPWAYEVLDEVDSTNTCVARRPAWTAVRARTQTTGRGRTPDRRWVSDAGGLWLSAVLPCPEPRARWETLPLAAGWAVVNALSAFGVAGARLRWPNDVMVGQAKLAGLLVERYTAETAVVGIGINVFNRPEIGNPELTGHTARLCGLVCGEYDIDDVARAVLSCLHQAHAQMLAGCFARLAAALNEGWAQPRAIALTFTRDGQTRRGHFHGIDDRGRLRVKFAGTPELEAYDATQISLLRELA